jgi:hypothetical protein
MACGLMVVAESLRIVSSVWRQRVYGTVFLSFKVTDVGVNDATGTMAPYLLNTMTLSSYNMVINTGGAEIRYV